MTARKFVLVFFTSLILLCLTGRVLDINTDPERVVEEVNARNGAHQPEGKIGFFEKLSGYFKSGSHSPGITTRLSSYLSERYVSLKASWILYNFKSRYGYRVGFALMPEHAIFKLDRDLGNLKEPEDSIDLYSACEEWESFQVAVVPFCDSLSNVQVSMEGLPFPIGNAQCWQGEYVNCLKPAYKVDHTGWYADPLMEMKEDSVGKGSVSFKSLVYPFTVLRRQAKSVWVNYFVPENTPPGDHFIHMTVSGLNPDHIRVSQSVTVKLHVFGFTLPRTMHLKTAFSFDPYYIKYIRYYKDFDVPPARNREYYSFLLSYRLNPAGLYVSDTYPPPDDWKWCIDHGANALCMGYAPDATQDSVNPGKYTAALKQKMEYLRRQGLEKYAYLYGFDEIQPHNYWKLTGTVDSLRHYGAVVPFASTVAPDDRIKDKVDIWVPLTENFNPEKARQYKDSGKELWWYVCNYPDKEGYPNFFTEYPAIAPRLLFWQTSRYDISGFLYYKIMGWQNNTYYEDLQTARALFLYLDNPYIEELKKGRRWPDIPWVSYSFMNWNGDGQLVYPGRDGHLWPSIRLINIRDGIEDYEYMYSLKTIRGKLRQEKRYAEANVVDRLLEEAYAMVPAVNSYKDDPLRLLQIRKKMGALLEKYSGK